MSTRPPKPRPGFAPVPAETQRVRYEADNTDGVYLVRAIEKRDDGLGSILAQVAVLDATTVRRRAFVDETLVSPAFFEAVSALRDWIKASGLS